jgi:NarL family two-component system response regulator LiaR
MDMPITVLIVDGYETARNEMHSFLETQPDFKVIGEVSSAQEAIDIVTILIPDIVVLDVTLADRDYVETTARIRKDSPHTLVIILTPQVGEQYGFPALKAGASLYLLNDIKPERLAEAMRGAVRGEEAFQPQVAARILQYLRGEQADSDLFLSSLSDREMDILRLIACGLSNSQITQKLQISENTIRGHISNIRTKLQIANCVQSAIFGRENAGTSPARTSLEIRRKVQAPEG